LKGLNGGTVILLRRIKINHFLPVQQRSGENNSKEQQVASDHWTSRRFQMHESPHLHYAKCDHLRVKDEQLG
jgi:hypothetical protein